MRQPGIKIRERKALSFDCNGLQTQWPDRDYKYFICSVLGRARQQEEPRRDGSHDFFIEGTSRQRTAKQASDLHTLRGANSEANSRNTKK